MNCDYEDDLKDYEDFEIITKNYINSKNNIFNEKSNKLLNSQKYPKKHGKIAFIFADWL